MWVPTVFTKNRDRLLTQAVARSFFRRVVERARPFMSDEHFTVDGTLIGAWASQKSFQRKDSPPDGDGRNFHGQRRSNDTRRSTIDPDARLYRKSRNAEAQLAYLGHVLMENRHGLVHFDTHAFTTVSRDLGFTPHVSQNLKRAGGSAIDARTTRHPGYAVSQSCRPRIERVFAWLKPVAGVRKVKLRGIAKIDQ